MYCQLLEESKLFSLGCETTFWQSVWQLAGEPAFRNIGLLVVAVIGVGFAFYRSVKLHQQTKTAIRQAETSEAGLNIDRFQKGAAMLGDKRLSVREAGVFILSELAQQNPIHFFDQVQKTLCSFIRDQTRNQMERAGINQVCDSAFKEEISPDCQTVLEELSNLNNLQSSYAYELGQFDLSFSNLRFASLDDCNFNQTNFYGSNMEGVHANNANLCYSSFRHANLRHAWMMGSDLKGTNFIDTELDSSRFCGSDASSSFFVRSNILNTRFTKVKVDDTQFYNANFKGTDLRGTALQSATGVKFTQLSQAKNVDPEFLAKLKAEEEAAATEVAEENTPN